MKTFYLLITITLLLNSQSFSQAGTLDYSFGDSGIIYNKILGTVNASALQKDGKILYGGASGIYPYYYVARHNADGSLDNSFGKNGIANIKELNELTGLKILDDGRIITGGNGGIGDAAAAMFKPNGTLDSSFGSNGSSIIDYCESDYINTMGVQPDGKILLAGSCNTIGVSTYMLVARLNKDGSNDKSFGNDGAVINTAGREITCLDVQQDGKFITAGHIFNGGFSDNFLINRYNNDGSYDKSFGTNGSVSTIFNGGNSLPFAIKILPDGKFFVAGVFISTAVGLHSNMVIAKYNMDGSLDKTFGVEGSSMVDFNKKSGVATNILLQKDNKIILTGYTADCYGCSNGDIALARLNADGTLDSVFGINGQQRNDFGSVFESSKTSLLQNDNKIVVLGVDEVTADAILVRYNNDEANKKQILITKIKRWLQHKNGFTWDYNNNASSYVVQRSYDGIHFSSVARINAGNSSNTYADPSPLSGNNYYRLQTTSTDGAVNYSNVIAVTANEDAVKISPNPAKNNLQIQGLSSLNTKLTVVDFTGNLKLQAVATNASYTLNIAALKPGNYLLKIENNGEVVSKKFVKE
ncbi:MAG: T9SS type A sorting domain-containing protein [Parafilimonas sp.]